MSSVRYWIWLSSVTYANPRAKYALVERWGDAESAFLAPPGAYRDLPGVSANEAELFERRDLREADRILEACRREDIRILTLADAAYPQRLRNIFAPPVVLYIKGRLPDVDSIPSVAVIGTRRATPYGLKMGRDIAFEIASCGGIVVSGLTEGIDRAAARGCLLAGGCCIGVLGTGHGAGGELREDVAATGALVSEYPPGTQPFPAFFPQRNRIISGLSYGTVVVEAAERSGSLITAELALSEGRDVFAVPGSIYSDLSKGCNRLIRQGAKLTASAEDILDEYAWAEKEKPGKRQPTLFKENEPEGLSDEEKTVYAILSKEESLSVDEIIYRLHGRGDASNVAFLLLQMQLKGLVEEDENRAYSRA